MSNSLKRIGATALVALVALGGCTVPPEHKFDPLGDLPTYGALSSETHTDAGKRYFRDGAYGLAETAFRKAIEDDHNNTEAWLGLAASYDHLKRFDLADRAYEVVIKQVGYTPTVLNNLGIHQLLRGNRKAAEKNLTAALSGNPESSVIHNNLLRVDNPNRAPDAWKTHRTN